VAQCDCVVGSKHDWHALLGVSNCTDYEKFIEQLDFATGGFFLLVCACVLVCVVPSHSQHPQQRPLPSMPPLVCCCGCCCLLLWITGGDFQFLAALPDGPPPDPSNPGPYKSVVPVKTAEELRQEKLALITAEKLRLTTEARERMVRWHE